MTGLFAPPILAFQVWDVFGWLGTGIFAWRTVGQWILSEKAKRSVVPHSFWSWSLLGSALLVVYAIHRREPVFLLGAIVNGCFFARSWWLSRNGDGVPNTRRVLRPATLGLVVFAAIVIEAIGPDHGLVRFDYGFAWMAVGFAGQAFWIGRFVVQAMTSERLGKSVLPESFFWMSLAGAVLLLAYAIYRLDWPNIAGYGPNAIPYARNLILMRRTKRAAATAPAGAESPTGPASA